MKTVLFVFSCVLLFAGISGARSRDRSFCTYVDSEGNFYDLSALSDPSGGAYSFLDGDETIYFNICGNLSELETSACAGSSAGSCYIPSTGAAAENLGDASDSSFTDYTGGGYGVTLTYANGDACNVSSSLSSRWQTILSISCPDAADSIGLGVTSFDVVGPCTMQLNLTSAYACPSRKVNPVHMWLVIMFWVLMCSACVCCCGCCCCLARRHRARSEAKRQIDRIYASSDQSLQRSGQYVALPVMPSPTPVRVAAAVPVAEPPAAAAAAAAAEPVFPTAAYFYPPTQFYPQMQMPAMVQPVSAAYPSPSIMQAVPPPNQFAAPMHQSSVFTAPAPAPAPAAPVNASRPEFVRANASINASADTSNDEQLARALQAKYDNEASLL